MGRAYLPCRGRGEKGRNFVSGAEEGRMEEREAANGMNESWEWERKGKSGEDDRTRAGEAVAGRERGPTRTRTLPYHALTSSARRSL
jgi:hypothetical protein